MMRCCLLFCLLCAASAADLPAAQAGAQERHGTFNGQPFWLRLQAPAEQFGGLRILELLYTPPSALALAGTVLADHPFILLDDELCVRAWNERSDSGSLAEYRADLEPPAYEVVAEVHSDGGETVNMRRRRQPSATPAWDRRLVPLMLLLTSAGEGERRVTVLDIYHLADAKAGELRIVGDACYEGQELAYRLERAEDGSVRRVLDAAGAELVLVGTLPPATPLDGQQVEAPHMAPE